MQEHFLEDELDNKFEDSKSQTGKKKGVSRLFICGTNAYNPRCRYYKMMDNVNNTRTEDKNAPEIVFEKEVSGKGFCPYDPRHNSTFLYTGMYYKNPP